MPRGCPRERTHVLGGQHGACTSRTGGDSDGEGPPEGCTGHDCPGHAGGDGDLTVLDVWNRDGALCNVGGQNDLANKQKRAI